MHELLHAVSYNVPHADPMACHGKEHAEHYLSAKYPNYGGEGGITGRSFCHDIPDLTKKFITDKVNKCHNNILIKKDLLNDF